ncbi:hypothetical protein NPIL_439991 [Nephila pilipes]|uniref:Uncharacterized protein n=1 Tax=Nephila pilipes TaxID=299642 RepID=A0A8X6PSI7_NEPPI|nr:hypothetical protein NPIL_439991 [Nephila pilipes]
MVTLTFPEMVCNIRIFGNNWIGRGSPVARTPRSLNLTTLNHSLCDAMKSIECNTSINSEVAARISIVSATISSTSGIFENVKCSPIHIT